MQAFRLALLGAVALAPLAPAPVVAQAAPQASSPAAPRAAPGASEKPAAAARPEVDPQQAEVANAWRSARAAATLGPAKVELAGQAGLDLPKGEIFIPGPQAARVLQAYGNRVMSDPVGLVAPVADGADWLVVVRFVSEGYVKDEDAKNWNADELLGNLREGNEASNKIRAERGFPEVEMVGWLEPPAYDAQNHRLVWATLSRRKGAPAGEGEGVNFNTYALGRDGYFSLNLLTSPSDLEKDKPVARQLLAGLGYNEGKRYADFDASTDKVAAYGLAALVGGAAIAKKAGLFALIGVLALKFSKLIVAGVAVLGVGLFKLLGRGK